MLRTHYRSPFNFSDANLDDARNGLRRLYTALDGLPAIEAALDWSEPRAAAFRTAMNDDFNTPVAVAVLFELAGELNRTRSLQAAALLRGLGGVLGLLQDEPRTYLQAGGADADADAIGRRIAARDAAKRARDFVLADRIRDELAADGVIVQDSPQGTTWMKA